MRESEILVKYFEYDSPTELASDYQVLVEKAKDATKDAYAPYSKFRVGAAVLLENGEIITGTNQENAAYPSGLCAERVAIFYANSKYPSQAIKAIAVASFYNGKFNETPVYPCGSCRQVLLETQNRFNKPMDIIMYGSNSIQIVKSARLLLPLCFDVDLKAKD
ncbi:cytidine deaminase [Williamwhitmania taraxaci]|uniref:Cytidine deaminase n=1 Tax=Williamwhitmania taraxaci TaxID=1640674 RepID=A0A1G6GPW2_9BACT|nr:cytidine deaminase [Williamwhitmania taraxaci]SDB84072.1 cytidine deaminase [Williamwhitmania taraxaci]